MSDKREEEARAVLADHAERNGYPLSAASIRKGDDPYFNRVTIDAMLAFASPGPAAAEQKPWANRDIRQALVEQVMSYGPRCRDCADENGVCPMSGIPCDNRLKATEFVVDALIYGAVHGYCPTTLTSVRPTAAEQGEGVREALKAARDGLLREAIHMEQDFPGNVPEDCGWWCRLCNDHVEGDRRMDPSANGHKPDCPVAKVQAALAAQPNEQEAGGLREALQEIVDMDDEEATTADLMQHDRNAGYLSGARDCANIARAALAASSSLLQDRGEG